MNQTKIGTNSWHYKLVKNKVKRFKVLNERDVPLLLYISWIVIRILFGIGLLSVFSFVSICMGSTLLANEIPPNEVFHQDFWMLFKFFIAGGTLFIFIVGFGLVILLHNEIFANAKRTISFEDESKKSKESRKENSSDKL